MPILEASEFKSFLQPPARLMGLDVGTKTIGIAFSDPNWVVASPHDTIQRTKFSEDIIALEKLYRERDIKGLVIGLPMDMDGQDGPRAQSTRQFARNILKSPLFSPDTPIAFWDERFSTQTVEQMMIEELDLSRKKRAGDKDKLAAALILQGFLDFGRNL